MTFLSYSPICKPKKISIWFVNEQSKTFFFSNTGTVFWKMRENSLFMVLFVVLIVGYDGTTADSTNVMKFSGHSRHVMSCSGETSGVLLEQWYRHAQLVFTANVNHIDRRLGALNVTLRRIIRTSIQVPFRCVFFYFQNITFCITSTSVFFIYLSKAARIRSKYGSS